MDDRSSLESHEDQAVDLFNRADSRALINMVSPETQAAMLRAASLRPDLLGLDEDDLWQKLKEEAKIPNATDNRLRLQFWLEYDEACNEGRRMMMKKVYGSICQTIVFHRMLERPERVAWLLTKPAGYEHQLKEALSFGMKRIRDILQTNPTDVDKKDRHRLLELQTKIAFALDQRVNGAFVQKIEQKNMNLNINTDDKELARHIQNGNIDDLNRRLADLERRERKALNLPDLKNEITVESKVVVDAG
jgi:hypothetical protein